MFDYSKEKARIGDKIQVKYDLKGEEYKTLAEVYEHIDPTYMYSDDYREYSRGPGYKIKFIDNEGFERHHSQWDPYYRDELNVLGRLNIIPEKKPDTCIELGELTVIRTSENEAELILNGQSLTYYKDTVFTTKSWYGKGHPHWDPLYKFNGYLTKLKKAERKFVDEKKADKSIYERAQAFHKEWIKTVILSRFARNIYINRNWDKLIEAVEPGKMTVYKITRKTTHRADEFNNYLTTKYMVGESYEIDHTVEHLPWEY